MSKYKFITNKKNSFEEILECLTIISLIVGMFANVVSFYLTGNKNELTRKIISHGFIFGVAFLLLSYVVHKFFSSAASIRRKIVLCIIPLLINFGVVLAGVIKTGGRTDMLKNLLACGSYNMSLVCGAIYIMAENKFSNIVKKTKYVAVFLIPYWIMALNCFWSLKWGRDNLANFGQISYLDIGYSTAIIYSILLCDLGLHFYKKSMGKVALGLNFAELILCSLIALMAGARGAFLSWVIVNVVATVIMFLKHEKKAIIGIVFSIVAVAICIVAAPSDNTALRKQQLLVNEVKGGELARSIISDKAKELLNELYDKADSTTGGVIGVIEVRKDAQEGNVSQTESNKESEDILYAVTNGSMARSYLWQLAIKEMRHKPLIGMGSLGFQIKYGTYPHNVLLECLSDFGILGFIIYLVFCGIIIFLVFKYSTRERRFWNLIIIGCIPAMKAMISGHLYNFSFLLFVGVMAIWKYLEDSEICKREIG